jgi:3-methylcrotonyl-CoA carboxylase alpha subunit
MQIPRKVISYSRGCRLIRVSDMDSPWNRASNFRVNSENVRTIKFKYFNKTVTAEIVYDNSEESYRIRLDGDNEWQELQGTFDEETGSIALILGDERIQSTVVFAEDDDSIINVFDNGIKHVLRLEDATSDSASIVSEGLHKDALTAPMPGKIVKVNAQEGSKVKKGAVLVIMEAMKMEHVIKAPHDGVIGKVNFKEGDFVQANATIVAYE